MTAEKPILSRQDIQKAERAVGFTHPVLDVINTNLPQIQKLQTEFESQSNIDEQTFIEQNWGFLANELVSAGNFSLTTKDIISLWSQKEIQNLSLYQKYIFSRIIATSYAIQGIENQTFQQLPRLMTENIEASLDFLFEQDPAEVNHMNTKINELTDSLQVLSNTNKFAKQKDPILHEITENFGNGLVPVRLLLETIIE